MQHRPLKWRILRQILIGAGFYVAFVVLLAIFQRSLMYRPERCPEAAALDKGRLYGAAPWRDAQGAIIGWRSPERKNIRAANRLLVFHGNAGNALDRIAFIEGFEKLEHGSLWQVFLFEYPGYGARPGPISESEFKKAGAAALAKLRENDSRPVYVAGESLGSGLACAMAHDLPEAVAGVLLVTPFSSMADAAASHYPTVPVRLLVRDRWNNLAALPSFHGPVAITLAGEDTVIPIAEGKRLFAVANEPKRLWIMPGVDHNDIDYSSDSLWWVQVSSFLLNAHRH